MSETITRLVEHYGDHPLRFLVRSATRKDTAHLVDLGENFPLGKCACEQYSFRVQPKIDKGEPLNVADRCKHIDSAREFLLAEVILRLKTTDGEGT